MIKKLPLLALFGSTLFCASSAYDIQSFVDQASRASGIFAGKAINTKEDGQDLYVAIGEYEWMVTDDDNGELKFSIDRISANNEELIAALDEFYTSYGESLQDNACEIEDALEGVLEAANPLEGFREPYSFANLVRQTGHDFRTNANTYSAQWLKNYMEAGKIVANDTQTINEYLNNELQDIDDFDSGLVAFDIDESFNQTATLAEPAFDNLIASINFHEADISFQNGYKYGQATTTTNLRKPKL